jgi:hypothetical protein
MTRCAPCERGEHGLCEEIAPIAVDVLGRPIPGAGFTDCRCFCDVRDRAVEHLKLAADAAEAGRVDEAKKHTDAARELLEPPPRKFFVLRDPERFYEGALARRGAKS